MNCVSFTVKKHLLFTVLICTCVSSLAQKSGQRDWEIGASAGVSWYNGDMNPNVFFGRNYMSNAYGLHFRKNLNKRFALKAQFNYGTLKASDELSTSSFQQNRNLSFTTPIYELATTIEFNFFEFDPLINRQRISPYTFIGLGTFRFNPSTEVEGSVYELQPLATEGKRYLKTGISLPFGMGAKWAITDRIIANAEWGLRRTFTDYLDDVSDEYPRAGELSGLSENLSDRSLAQNGPDGTNWGTQRGNAQTTDWYSFVTAGLSIRLGPKKGSCKHIGI